MAPGSRFPLVPSSSLQLRLPGVKGMKIPGRLSLPAKTVPSRLSYQHSWHSLVLSGIILAGESPLLWSGDSQQAPLSPQKSISDLMIPFAASLCFWPPCSKVPHPTVGWPRCSTHGDMSCGAQVQLRLTRAT